MTLYCLRDVGGFILKIHLIILLSNSTWLFVCTHHSDSVRSSNGADNGGGVGFAQSLSHDEISEIEVRYDEPREQQNCGQGQE